MDPVKVCIPESSRRWGLHRHPSPGATSSTPHQAPRTPQQAPRNSPTSASSSPVSGSSPLVSETSPLVGEESAASTALVRRVAQQRRAKAEDVRAAILALTRDRYLSIHELADALQRKPVTLRRYLGPMADEGLLSTKYPDQPSHPAQAYRSRKDPTP